MNFLNVIFLRNWNEPRNSRLKSENTKHKTFWYYKSIKNQYRKRRMYKTRERNENGEFIIFRKIYWYHRCFHFLPRTNRKSCSKYKVSKTFTLLSLMNTFSISYSFFSQVLCVDGFNAPSADNRFMRIAKEDENFYCDFYKVIKKNFRLNL